MGLSTEAINASELGSASTTNGKSMNLKNPFWSGDPDAVVDRSRFVIDGQNKIQPEDCTEDSWLGQEMKAKFNDVGLVYVKNTGLKDMALQKKLATIITGLDTEYEGGANPRARTDELDNAYDTGAPPEACLAYHHEMCYKSYSIASIAFLCKDNVTSRPEVGWTFVSDAVKVHEDIMKTPLGQKLKEKGVCLARRMEDANSLKSDADKEGVYNSWQQSWMTDDPVEAEKKAQSQDLEVEWHDDGKGGKTMIANLYRTGFEYVPSLDQNLLIFSVGDGAHFFDNWPGIGHLDLDKRPLRLLYGDKTPFTPEEYQEWTDIMTHHGIPITWQPGDVAVLCNMRFLHGRPSIDLLPGEKRSLGVVLGQPLKLNQCRPDKW